ncbi:heavy metal translocating P-type ATPase [Nodularia spumigena]|uniref:heavy metal translocating P-type ATPase n=1 Tax=Nodularia spumigena TaxID=70799 RepID=UPI002B1EB161|nr:heavy metal translocating P-type ATPase [Nodularia spumigena]MEA5556244.1 heavy metal translocating P-type ATPase [Nodularia spumigena CH309]
MSTIGGAMVGTRASGEGNLSSHRDAQAATVEHITCAHCTLPVPSGLIEPEKEHQFCCHGCSAAYEIIHGCGLERFYALHEATDGPVRAARGTGRRYAEFDDPTFETLYVRSASPGTAMVEFFLEGVHCAACVWLVERLPRVLPGVLEARLDLRRALVMVTWDPSRVALSRIGRTLDSLGYPPHVARERAQRDLRRSEDRRTLIRIGLAGACAGNVMLLAFALYSGLFDTMEPEYLRLFRWVSMFLSVVAVLGPGWVFTRGAIASLRARTVHLDVPIALGLLAGLAWGVYSTIRGVGEVYFDSLSVLVFVLLVGRWVQQRQQRSASDAVELLYALTPSRARLWSAASDDESPGTGIEVPIEAVSAGQIIQVLAGETFPADGVVTRGQSTIDQALLTGESRPVSVARGDSVAAGAVNVGAEVLVRVDATGEATRVGKLMKLVQDASQRRSPIVILADRIAGVFVVCMIALALTTVLLWMPGGLLGKGGGERGLGLAIEHAAALLVVTCPCALGLATPLAMSVAIGRAARRGMLLKGGEPLQLLTKPGLILLDKTGTITRGTTVMHAWHGAPWARDLVAALEAESNHPVARAIVRGLDATPHTPHAPHTHAPTEVEFASSGGRAMVNNRRVVVGSVGYVTSQCGPSPAWAVAIEREATAQAQTPVLVAIDGTIEAVITLGDPIRDDSGSAIDALRARGWRVGILSGDHPDVVASVATRLGITPDLAIGGCDPETKLAIVRSHMERGPVVMVGDGVNDSAALAAATVGIAVHGGAEASLVAADVYLGTPGLWPILDLLDASRRTMRVIYRNLTFSLMYNIGAASFAMAGLITPLIAAILMPASSLTVLASSVRVRTFARTRPSGDTP